MKKIVIILTLFISMAGQLVMAADDEKVTRAAQKAFEKEFPGALSPKWEKLQDTDTYLVRFVYNSGGMIAYINNDGAMLATARIVEKENLPFRVNEKMARKYPGFRINKIEELSTATDVSYLLTIENIKERISLQAYGNGIFYRLKKEKIK
ncbi:MAG TPA: hypothetical protein VF487_00365 [Chitinophagaceae bacterium]